MAENDEIPEVEGQSPPEPPKLAPPPIPPDTSELVDPAEIRAAVLKFLELASQLPPPVGDLPENKPDNQPRRLRWSPSAKGGEGGWVEDFAIPEGTPLVRWCRVDDGVVQDTPIWVYTNPNDSECNLPGTWYLCPDLAVQNKYLYDVNTGVYSPPPPWDPPPEYVGTPASASSSIKAEDLVTALRDKPELRDELRKLLLGDLLEKPDEERG